VTINNEQKKTSDDGVVTFTIKEGPYLLEIKKIGYTNLSENVVLTGNLNLTKKLVPIQTPKYLFTVTIVDENTQLRIGNVNVTVDDIMKVTDPNGSTSFILEAGTHQLNIDKNEYTSVSEVLQISEAANITRGISKLPPPPAKDWSPLMVFIHPPLAISSYVFIFAFTAYLYLLESRTKSLARIGFASWGLTLSALVTGMIWAQSAWGSYWSWEPKEYTSLAIFILVSATVICFHEGRMNLARGISLLSCIPILLSLPSYFTLVGFGLILLVVAIRSDRVDADRKTRCTIQGAMNRLNRFISWIFLGFAFVSLLSGYVMTRQRLIIETNVLIHTDLGYIFAVMLAIHVILSLLGGYPWKRILVNFIDKRNAWTFALMLQVITALLLLVLSAIQVLTGLGYINSDVASLVPQILHMQVDYLLLYTLSIHGVIGLRAVMMRNRLEMPGKDLFYLLLAVTLLIVFYLLKP
jgi:succinate dehydrogenase hydrophobic anchor subunit